MKKACQASDRSLRQMFVAAKTDIFDGKLRRLQFGSFKVF